MHPGLLRSPAHLIRYLHDYADAVDGVFVGLAGFGLVDVLAIAAQLMAQERVMLAPHWMGARAAPHEPPKVTSAEIDAASEFLSQCGDDGAALVELTDLPDPTRRDAAWHTGVRDAGSARVTAAVDAPMLGCLGLRGPRGTFPVPGGLVLDGVTRVADELLDLLSHQRARPRGRPDAGVEREVREAQRRLHQRAQNLLGRFLGSTDAHLFGPVDLSGAGEIAALAVPGERHLLAVDLVAHVMPGDVPAAVEKAVQRIARLVPGAAIRLAVESRSGRDQQSEQTGTQTSPRLPFDGGRFEAGEPVAIRAGTTVRGLVLVSGPRVMPWASKSGVVVLDLRVFTEIVQRADHFEELWSFLDELAEPRSARESLDVHDVLDLWALWQQQGFLHAGPAAAGGVRVPRRDPDAEWQRTSDLDPYDELLSVFDFPPPEGWPHLIVESGGKARAVRRHPDHTVLMSRSPPLIVLADATGVIDGAPGTRAVGLRLADVIRQRLTQPTALRLPSAPPGDAARAATDVKEVWRSATAGVPALVVLWPVAMPDAIPIDLAFADGADPRRLVLRYDPVRVLEVADADVIEQLLGKALVDGLIAWLAMMEGFSVGAGDVDASGSDADVTLDLARYPRAVAAARTFLSAWCRLPAELVVRNEVTPFQAREPGPARTTSGAGRARAILRVAAELSERRVQLHEGAAAVRFAKDRLGPAVLCALEKELSAFSGEPALLSAADQMERLLAQQARAHARRSLRDAALAAR